MSLMLLCFSLGAPSAEAQQVPRFDIEATCKAAQPLTAEDRNPYESCMRDEIDAERQLKGMWSSASTGHRETCGQEAQIGGTPSYVDMLTCLQLAQGTASTAPPQRRRAPR
jgi:hypothetical protein